jgi:integrase
MGSFYADERTLLNGAIKLYRRRTKDGATHPIWQARFKLAKRRGYIIESLGTSDYEEAAGAAQERLLDLRHKAKNGLPLTDWTFAQHLKDFLEITKLSPSRKALYGNWEKFFLGYFGDKKLADMNQAFADRYWEWRRAYWDNHESTINYNPRRKNAKNKSSRNVARNPANKTLRMEQGALNRIFRVAHDHQRMARPIVMPQPFPDGEDVENPRSAFSVDEWQVLESTLHQWAFDGVDPGTSKAARLNSYLKHRRQQIFFFVMVQYSAGLRPGEPINMKWEDYGTIEQDGQTYAVLRVPLENKTGKRILIPTHAAIKHLDWWKSITKRNGPQDYIWQGQGKGDQNTKIDPKSFNKTFTKFLASVPFKGRNLLRDADGKKRVTYCLRHTYAVHRLLHSDANYHDLARNMGTSIKHIETTYARQVTNIDRAEVLTSDNRPMDTRQENGAWFGSAISEFSLEEIKRLQENPQLLAVEHRKDWLKE